MRYILVGLVAFLLAPAFEIVSIKGVRGGKQIVGLILLILWGVAICGVCADPRRLSMTTWVVIPAWITLVLASVLLVYSLLIELPFRSTYHLAGGSQRLVTTGTYALVRHPGVLWFGLLLLSLALVSGSRAALLAAPIWLGADVLYAWIQDRYLFPRMFPGYEEYQQTVPMLIPTRASLRRCLQTLRRESDGHTPRVVTDKQFTREHSAHGAAEQERR